MKFISEKPENYVSCNFQRTREGKGEFVTEDPHKIESLFRSKFIRDGEIHCVGVSPEELPELIEKYSPRQQSKFRQAGRQPKVKIEWGRLVGMAKQKGINTHGKKRPELEAAMAGHLGG